MIATIIIIPMNRIKLIKISLESNHTLEGEVNKIHY